VIASATILSTRLRWMSNLPRLVATVDEFGPVSLGVRQTMSVDEQDEAEATDDEMIDGDDPASAHEAIQFPPDHPRALPFADADITDESFGERTDQLLPEVSERDIDESDADSSDNWRAP
jgi:hypothetical protein